MSTGESSGNGKNNSYSQMADILRKQVQASFEANKKKAEEEEKVAKAQEKAAEAEKEAAEEEKKVAKQEEAAAKAEAAAEKAEKSSATAQQSAASVQKSSAAAPQNVQQAVQNTLKEDKNKKNKAETEKRIGSTSGLKLLIGLIFYAIYEFVDAIVMIVTGGASEGGEWIADIAHYFILDWVLGEYAYIRDEVKLFGLSGRIVEFIPVVDVYPTYTITLWKARKQYKKDHENLKSGKTSSSKVNINLRQQAPMSMKRRIIFGIVAFLIISGVFFMATSEGFVARISRNIGRPLVWLQEGGIAKMFNYMQGLIARLFEYFTRIFERQAQAAITGQSFSGEVDRYANQALGLDIEIEKPDYYFLDNDAFITGVLSGRNLNPNICDTIGEDCTFDNNIDLSCTSNKGEQGVMSPSTEQFTYLQDSFTPFTCTFDEFNIVDNEYIDNKAKRTIRVNADFKFLTASYLRKQFVQEDKLNELKRSDYFFEKFQPQYTPGLVSVEFLDSFVDQNPLRMGRPTKMGIRIENTGKGILKKVNKLSIINPEGVEMKACVAGGYSENIGNEKLVLTENSQFLNDPRNKNLAKGRTITIVCDIEVTNNALQLNSDITTDFFKVILLYDYSISEKQEIEVRKREEVS